MLVSVVGVEIVCVCGRACECVWGGHLDLHRVTLFSLLNLSVTVSKLRLDLLMSATAKRECVSVRVSVSVSVNAEAVECMDR